MKIEVLILGPVRTNCYILSDEETMEAIVIDPAEEPDRILKALKDKGYQLKAVLLTHGHFDHITGLKGLLQVNRVPVYAMAEEKDVLADPQKNQSVMLGYELYETADHWLLDGESFSIGSMKFKAIGTPGHTKGSGCYYMEEEKVLFCGDTLFLESVGRTDLPTGNSDKIVQSLTEKLWKLPDDTKAYPGHGSFTSIGYEKKNNPYA